MSAMGGSPKTMASSPGWPSWPVNAGPMTVRPSGMVMVERIVRVGRSQSRSVLAFWIPAAEAGFKIVTGTTKSEVRMMFFSQSMERP